MFKFFKKEYLRISKYPELWGFITEDSNSGKVRIIRINMGYKDAIGHPDYQSKMGIAIPVKEHNEEIVIIKRDMENILNEILLNKDEGALVAIITGVDNPRFIEFLSYTKKSFNFKELHQLLKERFKNYEVQMYADIDPNWEAYKSFAHI